MEIHVGMEHVFQQEQQLLHANAQLVMMVLVVLVFYLLFSLLNLSIFQIFLLKFDNENIDTNECNLGIDNCHPFAICTNTLGSFSCQCKSGYFGDGFFCSDDGFFFFFFF